MPSQAPPTLLYFKEFIIKSTYSNSFVLLIFSNNIILHTSPNDSPLFNTEPPKITLYQILSLFYRRISPKGSVVPAPDENIISVST